MTKIKNVNTNQVVVAAVVAAFLMVAFGIGHRVLAARLAAPGNATPISSEALAGLPMQIGDWTGLEAPIDEAIVRATDTDAHVSRRYVRNNAESVYLWIAAGVKARDLMPHHPEVCYTGSGWTVVGHDVVEVPLDDDVTLSCSGYLFSRGSFNLEKVLVLYYYIVDGQYSHDVSLLRSKAWRGSGTVDYVAQVQVVTSIGAMMTVEEAKKTASEFIGASASLIAQRFEESKDEKVEDVEVEAEKVGS
jgi:EpsI family protein